MVPSREISQKRARAAKTIRKAYWMASRFSPLDNPLIPREESECLFLAAISET